MTAYFVTATGTGIGKTFTTCALLNAMPHARGFKPVISGWDEGAQTDTAQIAQASRHLLAAEEISPWRFTAPLSPHRAAALENRAIDVSQLNEWTCTKTQGEGTQLIETVGGVMVPLTNTHTTLDWMEAVKLPIILVTGSYLGTISHTLTALEALRARGLSIAALILNETAGSAVTLAETEAGLAPFIADIPLRITQPRVSSWKDAAAIHALGSSL